MPALHTPSCLQMPEKQRVPNGCPLHDKTAAVLVVVEVGLARTVDVDEGATVVVVSPDVDVAVDDTRNVCVDVVVKLVVVLVAGLVLVEVVVTVMVVDVAVEFNVDIEVDGVTQAPLEHTPLVPLMLQTVPLANTGPLKQAPELQIPACRHAPEKHRVPRGWFTHEVTTLVLVDVLVDVDVVVDVDVDVVVVDVLVTVVDVNVVVTVVVDVDVVVVVMVDVTVVVVKVEVVVNVLVLVLEVDVMVVVVMLVVVDDVTGTQLPPKQIPLSDVDVRHTVPFARDGPL